MIRARNFLATSSATRFTTHRSFNCSDERSEVRSTSKWSKVDVSRFLCLFYVILTFQFNRGLMNGFESSDFCEIENIYRHSSTTPGPLARERESRIPCNSIVTASRIYKIIRTKYRCYKFLSKAHDTQL